MYCFVGRYVDSINGEDIAFTSADLSNELMENNSIGSVTCTLWMALLADVEIASLMKTAFTSEDKARKLMEDNSIESINSTVCMALLAFLPLKT